MLVESRLSWLARRPSGGGGADAGDGDGGHRYPADTKRFPSYFKPQEQENQINVPKNEAGGETWSPWVGAGPCGSVRVRVGTVRCEEEALTDAFSLCAPRRRQDAPNLSS